MARGAGLDQAVTEGVIAEANVFLCRGDFPEARALFERVLETNAEPRLRGIALQNIGSILAQVGDLGAAEGAFAESSGCFHRAGYRRGEAIALNNHGRIALDRGDCLGAQQLLEQALAVARAVEDAELIALATLNYAEALEASGNYRKAEEMASTALGYFATAGNRWREIECLRRIGAINERCGDASDAQRCYDRALRIAEEIGARQDAQVVRDCLSRLAQRGTAGIERRVAERGPTALS